MLIHLHHNVVYVDVSISTKSFEEALLHATLKRGTGISQAECHGQVAKAPNGVMKAVFRRSAGFNLIW